MKSSKKKCEVGKGGRLLAQLKSEQFMNLSTSTEAPWCCWSAWFSSASPLPWEPTGRRAVLYVFTLGWPGHRLSINNYNVHCAACCCPRKEEQLGVVPTQLQNILTVEEWRGIIVDVQGAVAKTAPSTPVCCWMMVPILGWHLTFLPYQVCGTHVMIGDLQSVVESHRTSLKNKGVAISAGFTSQKHFAVPFISIELL